MKKELSAGEAKGIAEMWLVASHLVLIAGVCFGLAGCAGRPGPARIASTAGPSAQAALEGVKVDPGLRARILALDPNRISEAQVAQVLSKMPAPRIINIHGGVHPVRFYMKNFADFLIAMGYPSESIMLPGKKHSYSCYMESRKLAGAVGWYYEQTGMPVMIIGHSQGGVQALKVLHEISGSSGSGDLRIWNPVTGDFEQRTWIFEPRLRKRVPLKGLRPVIYVNAVAAGGATLAMPNQWDMIGRTRDVPDATYYFTGYFIPGDVWGGGVLGASSLNRYRSAGKAKVRNSLVSHGSKHGTVPVTWHLARNASSRQWVGSYHPSWRDKLPPNYEGPKRNLLWAANTWYEVKKCWCLALQEVMRRERVTGGPVEVASAGR